MRMTDTNPDPLPPRFLAWEACLNTRDLGGLLTCSGQAIRWKALVRSENTANLTLAGRQAVVDYGIRTVIDLRFPGELLDSPSPFAAPQDAPGQDSPDYLNIPLDADQDLVWPNEFTPAQAMCDLYVRLLETNRRHVAAVLTAVARARPGGVLFHCHAGKDRTGLVSAVLLALAGVPEEYIVEDYAVTYLRLEQRRLELLNQPDLTPQKRAYLDVLTRHMPETMHLTLAYLNQRYGSVEGYLRSASFSLEDQSRLCARLLA